MYRLPFNDDGKWESAGNADDPSGKGHGAAQYYAWDFGHEEGGEVRVARGGLVIDAKNNIGFNTTKPPYDTAKHKNKYGGGNSVVIRHRDNTAASYGHMIKGSVLLKKGDVVVQGQMIGKSGNTGNSYGPHLHFEVLAYWNSGYPNWDIGPNFPIIFQDKSHRFFRPRVSDKPQSDNDYERQEGWIWCAKCQGLFFGPGSKCPADSQAHVGGGNYILIRNTAYGHQQDWRWCSKCKGLFFGGHPGSKCPAGGVHSKTGSANYSLQQNIGPGYNRQENWRWCNKCQGLFFGGNPGSICPAGGAHSKTGSGNYVLYKANFCPVQGDWRECNKCLSLFFGGSGGGVCPAGGDHDKTGSKNYYITYGFIQYPGWHSYRRCKKCSVLFHMEWKPSKCAAGGDHDKTGSLMYSVARDSDDNDTILAPHERGWFVCRGCQTLVHSRAHSWIGKCANPLKPGYDAHTFDLLHQRHHGVLISTR